MTKGTAAFRIIISVLLVLTMLAAAFFIYGFVYFGKNYIHHDDYDIYVAGEIVTRTNRDDILGDGSVSYNASTNTLTFNNAVIEHDYAIVYSLIDLKIDLIGENKFICNGDNATVAVYASDGLLRKDLSFDGDGSLAIEFKNATKSGTGIVAEDLWLGADVTVTTPNCEDISNGIVCTSMMTLRNNAKVTINNGAARSSTAVSVRGNVVLESGTALNVTVAPGATDACNGLGIDGNLIMGKNVTLNVSIDDESAERSECIDVLGVMSVSDGSVVTASAKKACDIECGGAFVNYGATVNGEIEALGGIHDKSEN